MSRRRRALWVSCSLLLFVESARAQSDVERAAEATTSQRALAEVLFRQGRELMEQKRTTEACAKFAESLRLDVALGTSLNLAVCFETQGRLASAWSEYHRAASLARRAGDTARTDYAEQALERLETLLATLRVTLSPGAQSIRGLTLELDGKELGAATLDTPIPLDTGSHVLVARAEGHQPWSAQVQATAETRAMALTVPALVPVPAPAAHSAPALPAQGTPSMPEKAPERPGQTQRWLGLAAGGAGVAGVAVGSVFGLRALSKKGQRDDACPARGCSPAGIEAHRDARDAASVANVAFAAGGALLVAGGWLYFTAPEAPVAFTASPRSAYVSVHRSW